MTYPLHIAQRAAERPSFASILRWHRQHGTDTPEKLEQLFQNDVAGQQRSRAQFIRRMRRKYA